MVKILSREIPLRPLEFLAALLATFQSSPTIAKHEGFQALGSRLRSIFSLINCNGGFSFISTSSAINSRSPKSHYTGLQTNICKNIHVRVCFKKEKKYVIIYHLASKETSMLLYNTRPACSTWGRMCNRGSGGRRRIRNHFSCSAQQLGHI